MELLHERVAGLDVHRDTVVATVRVPGERGRRQVHTQTFTTMTPDLLALRDWLAAHGVTQVAMEATGVYWKPVYYLLEDDFAVLLVNAAHVKQVPGRKTDVADSAWLAQLLEHGLLRGSFVPPRAIRDLRDLTRYRKVLTQERTREVQRLHKVLQDAGLKLASVATDILGVSGRAMLAALVDGTADAATIAGLAKGRLREEPRSWSKPSSGASAPISGSWWPSSWRTGLPRHGAGAGPLKWACRLTERSYLRLD